MTTAIVVLSGILTVAGSLCGYVARGLVDGYRARERERVLRALGGELPDWEKQAREIEERAHVALIEIRDLRVGTRGARILWAEADTVRKRGRRRDKEWL